MNMKKLKNHLIENPDYIEVLLEKLFYNVKFFDNKSPQWRMSLSKDDISNHIRLYSSNLQYKDYKYNEKGDIFSLLMNKLNINLGKCINMLAEKSLFLGSESQKVEEVYGGYFKKVKKNTTELKIYSEENITSYPEIISKMFLRDGISIETQRKFNIRYDSVTNRVIIPCYKNGKLIGAIGRYNKENSEDIPKYLPILTYNKSKYLFGVDINYNNLINNRVIVIESEKSVLKAFTKGIKNVVALGGNSISKYHKELLYELCPSEIIVMFDKGLDKRNIIESNGDIEKELEKSIKNRLSILKSNNCFYSPIIKYINLNLYSEIKDKDNIFDYDNLNYMKYIDDAIIYN